MIAKAQAGSVCAFFGNVEINFTLRSVFTKFVSLQMITLWDCLTEV